MGKFAKSFTISTLAFVAHATAQNQAVVPPSAATVSGNSLDKEPFGYDQARHVQYVDRSLLTGVPANSLISRIAYRRTSFATATPVMTRTVVTPAPLWTLRLSNYTGSVAAPAPAFPLNTNTAWTTVFNSAIDTVTNFPPLSLPPSGLPDFLVQFPLQSPWVYTAVAGLGVDHYVYDQAARGLNYYVDAIATPFTSGRSELISPTSLGCPAGMNRAFGAAPNPGGGNLELLLFGAPASTPAFACLGASSSQWGALTLPFHLDGLGLASCFVYTDWTFVTGLTTDSAGGAEYRLAVPGQNALLGASLFGQWAVTDPRVNPAFPLATSDGLKFTLGTTLGGASPAMSVVSAVGNLAQGNGRVGFVQPGRGLIFRLSW